jgi:hypothetical protein
MGTDQKSYLTAAVMGGQKSPEKSYWQIEVRKIGNTATILILQWFH